MNRWLPVAAAVMVCMLTSAEAEAEASPHGRPGRPRRREAPPEPEPSLPEPKRIRATNESHTFQVYGGIRWGVRSALLGDALNQDYIDDRSSLGRSIGLQFGAGWVWRVFGVGAEFRTYWFSHPNIEITTDPSDNVSVNPAIEVVLKPRLGHRFRSVPVELYGALPHGYSIVSDDGFTIGLMLGATYFVRGGLGANVEIGYSVSALGDENVFGEVTLLRANILYAR
jgi:hypothetical protein